VTRSRPLLLGAVLLAFLLAAPASAAPPKIQVSAPLLQFARPGSFVPIQVDISAGETLEGEIEAKFMDGGGSVPGVTRRFHVPKGARKRVVVPLPIPDWGSEVFVTVRTGRGAPIAARKLPIHAGAMQRHALRVAVVGEEPLGWPLLGQVTSMPVPGHPDVADDDGYRNVLVQNLMPGDLPDHWFGYGSVDILVWRRPDPSGISAEQQEALRGWLAAGGTAVISLGDNHANWTASPLADLVPVEALGLTHSRSALNSVWEIAGAGLPPGVNKGGDAEEGEVGLPLLEVVPGAGVEAKLEDADGAPLILVHRPGAGQVVLLTFDVGAGELRGGFDRAVFWRRLLGLWEATPDGEGFGYASVFDAQPGIAGPPIEVPTGPCPSLSAAAPHYGEAGHNDPQTVLRTTVGVDHDPASWWTSLVGVLAQFDAASPLSLSFIVVFGLLYLFFIGPFDYLLLRKIGKPMLTWVTFPVLAIGFSVAASVVISQQKAGDSETHCLTTLDVMPGPGVVRGSSYCAIWASRRDDVEVSVDRGKGWVLPARHEDFDPSGYNSYGYTQAITGEDQRMSAQPGQALFSFEAAQWSTSNLRAVWVDGSEAEVDWYLAGDPDAQGSWIRNRTGVHIAEAWVVDGPDWYRVGRLPDGASREATLRKSGGPGRHDWQRDAFGKLWPFALEPIEDRVGHLHAGNPGRPMLIGFAEEAEGQPRFDGLRAIDSSVTLVRVQLTSPYEQESGG
jgi:hypothetical protein